MHLVVKKQQEIVYPKQKNRRILTGIYYLD